MCRSNAAGASNAGAGGTAGLAGAAGQAGEAGEAGGPSYTNPSCAGLTTLCQGESCCANTVLPTGTFMMGRSEEVGASDYYDYAIGTSNELPAHSVTVSSFTLDKYEVTVGRFRKFAAAYDAGWRPQAGEGAHPNIPGSGWDAATSFLLPTGGATMSDRPSWCAPETNTWTEDPGENEDYPVNCVSWHEAMAFCVWDGGRLLTEAEWEYAAACGGEERLFPWGSALPSVETARANSSYSDNSPLVPVGSHPTGAGCWGQQDLAGSMWEWIVDWHDGGWYKLPEASGTDVCNLTSFALRERRGGSWDLDGGEDHELRVTRRNGVGYNQTYNRYPHVGIRCARTP